MFDLFGISGGFNNNLERCLLYNFRGCMSGSFHFSFFGFWSKWTKTKENQLSSLFIFCIKNPHFAWKWQRFFSSFGQSKQKMINEKWNEPKISFKADNWLQVEIQRALQTKMIPKSCLLQGVIWFGQHFLFMKFSLPYPQHT